MKGLVLLTFQVFVLTTSLWHQVDFYCKELTSYDKMKQGPTAASQSILLDYITPILPSGLWQALKNRHWAVVASIMSYLMLHLCVSRKTKLLLLRLEEAYGQQTVLSAGFLFLSPIQISKMTDSMIVFSNFSAANLNLADINAGPVDVVYGVGAHGLPWPYGTTENLTVQTFEYNGTDDLSNSILTAQVPGFGVTMDCDPAEIGNISNNLIGRPWVPHAGILAEYLVGDVSGPGCQLLDVSLGQTPGHLEFTKNLNSSSGWKSNYQGFFDYYICNSGFNNVDAGNPDVPQPNATSPEDYRFLLTMIEVSFFLNNTLNNTEPDTSETTNWTASQSTAVLCKPSYSVDLYTVTLAPLNQTLLKAEKVSNTSMSMAGFNMKDLFDGIVMSLNSSAFGDGGADYEIAPVPSMFMVLEALLTEPNNNSGLEALIHPGLLRDLSTQALQGIGTQFAEQYLKQGQRQPLAGSVLMTEQRLQVKRLTVGLLLTTLGILAFTVLILVKIRPWNAAPCASESLSSAATILTASDALRGHLQTGGLDLNITVNNLESCDYKSVIGARGNFSIQPVTATSLPDTSSQPRRKKSKKELQPCWRPIATKNWFLVCILVVPLILIAVLEAIQQVSDRKRGIALLRSSGDSHTTISYVPVFVMLSVALMYESLDAAASIFAPFLALRRGDAQAARSISTNLVSKLPLYAFYLSLRDQHWLNSFTISAALISSFLTIAASGLYSPITVLSSRAVQMQQIDGMNLSHIDLSQGDNLAGETTKLMMFFNVSNPLWTYDNLIFPAFNALIPDSFLGSNATFEGVSVSTKLPALRPSLQCTMAPAENITNTANIYHSGEMQILDDGTYTYGDPGSGVFSIQETVFPWSLDMSNATIAEQLGSAIWTNEFIIPNDTETSISMTQVGFASPVVWVPPDEGSSVLQQTVMLRPVSLDIDPSAANFGFAAGLASGTKTSQMMNISLDGANTILANRWDMKIDLVVGLCYQILEEVQTNVTFNWPDMTTSQINTPVPDESTARVIMSNESSTPTRVMNTTGRTASAHWFGISLNMFLWALQGYNSTMENWLDAWFITLQDSKGGQPLSELLGQANQSELVNASSRLYARYAVQAINANMRISGAQVKQDLPLYNATLSVPVLRLQQNKGPKIVLQVLLGIMALCGAIASTMLNTKEVLRYSPCSIFGKMELLARSELCGSRKIIPEGAEWWDEKRRRRYGLFDGWFFSLGW